MAWSIPPPGGLDLVSLGALVHRLDPGVVPFHKATRFDVHVSGGEFNVAANLAEAFGMNTAIVSAMVRYPIGDLVAQRVRAMGVKSFYRMFEHDGATGPNIATVYSDRGFGVRAPTVFYNRAHEAAALLAPGDIDWGRVFGGGVRWFHSGGIFASLSSTTGELIVEGMRAAREAGAVVSFDFNYRPKLWSRWGGEWRANDVTARILDHVDVLLGYGGEDTANPDRFFESAERIRARHPRLRAIATGLRDVVSANRHAWSAVAWIDGTACTAPRIEIDVLDRVGGGDGFAAGLIYGILAGLGPEEAVRIGAAHGALVTTYPGDTTMATLEQVRALARGEAARIQR